MVADSAISYYNTKGELEPSEVRWRKLLWSERVAAGVSYWGSIGEITLVDFDEWLEWRIQNGAYSDLLSFADYLTRELNSAAKGYPITRPAGLHVSGYHLWADGVRRPVFIHIHNGHGHIDMRPTLASQETIIALDPAFVWAPRKLFEAHRDLPDPGNLLEAEIARLEKGWITSNGDFRTFPLVFSGMQRILENLRLIHGVSIPRAPAGVGSRVGLLNLVIKTIIDIHRMSSLSKAIGGKSSSLGIGPMGRYVGGETGG